jgi:hypothetical protein
MSQINTIPVVVPTARKRLRWPGISKGEEDIGSWLRGEANGDDVFEPPDIPNKGSSFVAINANSESSEARAEIWTPLRPPNSYIEICQSTL